MDRQALSIRFDAGGYRMTVSRVALLALALLVPSASQAGVGVGSCTIAGAEATVCSGIEFVRNSSHSFVFHSISGDGTTVVGHAGGPGATQPVRWVDGVLSYLAVPAGYDTGEVTAASRDGSVLVGLVGTLAGETEIVRWDASGGVEILELPDFQANLPTDISPDGEVIVGNLDVISEPKPFRWEAGAWEPLGTSEASHVARLAEDASIGRESEGAVVWSAEGALMLEGVSTEPGGISSDGSIAVGYAWHNAVPQAVRWDHGVPTLLALGAYAHTMAHDVTDDGSRIVGRGRPSATAPDIALVWDDGQIRTLADILSQDFGVTFTGHTLRSISRVSDDGRVVEGSARATNNALEVFVAVLTPELGIDILPQDDVNGIVLSHATPVTVVVFGSADADAQDLDVGSLVFGPARAPIAQAYPAADRNGDGFLDQALEFTHAEAGLALTDTRACLSGLADGYPFTLCSHVSVRNAELCGIGFELALVVPPLALWHRRLRRAWRRESARA